MILRSLYNKTFYYSRKLSELNHPDHTLMPDQLETLFYFPLKGKQGDNGERGLPGDNCPRVSESINVSCLVR